MKAVQKHGKTYKLIALAVKTKHIRQIRGHLKLLLEKIKVDKNHPDRHILRPFVKQQTVRRDWTHKETEVLVKAVKKYGKNYQMIANALKDRTARQVSLKVYDTFRSRSFNPKHTLAIKIRLKGISIPIPEHHVWTKKEDARIIKVLRHHGKDYKKLKECFPKLSHAQI